MVCSKSRFKVATAFGARAGPRISKGRQTSCGFHCTVGLVDGTGLLQQLLPGLLVRFTFELLTALISQHSATCERYSAARAPSSHIPRPPPPLVRHSHP